MPYPLWVLIVDDEPLVAMYVKDLLGDLGFEKMASAYDLPTARDLVRASTPALAILDVNIGQSLVFPFAAVLRVQNVPIVFCTGRSTREFPPDWTDYPVVTKPFDKKALATALDRLEHAAGGEGVAAMHHAAHHHRVGSEAP